MFKRLLFILILLSYGFAQESQTLKLQGLRSDVVVRRDHRHIPYIQAKNEDDLYFAQGFVTASDRLWQMDLLRRLARGETAEIFGNAALQQDKYWRRFGFSKIAEETLKLLDPKLRAAIESYANGVNAYIASLDDSSLPTEFKILRYEPSPWKPSDSIIIGKILADALSKTWEQDVLYAKLKTSLSKEKFADISNVTTKYDLVLFGKDIEKQPERQTSFNLPDELLDQMKQLSQVRETSLRLVGLYMEDLAASNNWVISGKRTLDKRPILANDPHLPPAAPGIWYLTHLSAGDLRVAGVTFPGVPGIILGHNDFIAWGATNVGPDVQDVYIESFNEDGKYETPNGWMSPLIRREEIKVRKSPFSTETESTIVEFVETRNGVVTLEDGKNKKYSLKWTALNPENSEFEAFYYLNRAKDWKEFKAALSRYAGPTQNFVYADKDGNIGWYVAGKIPIRRVGDGREPYDGRKNDGDWIGYVPFDELPNIFNPPDGLIVTANQRIVGTSYKYSQLVREIAPPWRARRIYELLRVNTKLTMNDVRDVQYDVFNIPLTMLAREIVKLSAASDQTLQILGGWDGKMTADSTAAVLVNEIRNCLAEKIADDNKPLPAYIVKERLLHRIIEEKPDYWLPKEFRNYTDFFKACDTRAQASLEQKLGADRTQWRWGKIYLARFPHPLAAAKDPFGITKQFDVSFTNVNGSQQTPNVGAFVSMRLIVSPGNWDETRQVIPLGQSGDPQSPFWKDQFEAWRTGLPQIFPFSDDAILKVTKKMLVLKP